MKSVLTLLIFVALPLGSSASGDADDKEICGELELEVEMAVTDQHQDEHVVEGIEEGLATYLGISKSYVHIKFDGGDHSGHNHARRLAVDHEVADYNITFPASGHSDHSAVTAASDLLKATKASTQHTSKLIANITAKVVSSIAAAKAAGETINLQIVGGELLNNPSIGHACHAAASTTGSTGASSGSTMLSCFLNLVVLLVAAMF